MKLKMMRVKPTNNDRKNNLVKLFFFVNGLFKKISFYLV